MGLSSGTQAAAAAGATRQRAVWRWFPSEGRWSLERHGFPKSPLFVALNTDGQNAASRYDYWRHTVFYDFDAHPYRAGCFSARGTALVGASGSFFHYQSDSISGGRTTASRGGDGGDDITIGIVLAGSRSHAEGENRTISLPGDIFVYDPLRNCEIAWTQHRGVHLSLRRTVVEDIFGSTVPSSADLARMLSASRLAPFLTAQMNLLAEHNGRLDEADRSSMLQSTIDLATMALRGIAGSKSYMEVQSSRDLLGLALHFIEANLSDQSLGPNTLARALGCSRATIYRAFSENELTVASVIRETRLKRAREMIETLPSHVSISDIAMRCGFFDASNFSRSFRARFGISPTDIRRGP